MIYPTPEAWLAAPERHVLLFGMSGLGKTHVAKLLRGGGDWFHYSVDYRIGTRHMGELIADNAKREAMKVPFLRDLLMNDSIHIVSNITFDNLDPVSTYLGKPGDPSRAGCHFPSTSAARPSSGRRRWPRSSTPGGSSTGRGRSTATPISSATRGEHLRMGGPETRGPILSPLPRCLMSGSRARAHTAELGAASTAPKPMAYRATSSWPVGLHWRERPLPRTRGPDDFIR
jgi:hypothetical protein